MQARVACENANGFGATVAGRVGAEAVGGGWNTGIGGGGGAKTTGGATGAGGGITTGATGGWNTMSPDGLAIKGSSTAQHRPGTTGPTAGRRTGTGSARIGSGVPAPRPARGVDDDRLGSRSALARARFQHAANGPPFVLTDRLDSSIRDSGVRPTTARRGSVRRELSIAA